MVVVRLPNVASVTQKPQVYECHGVLQHQNLDHLTAKKCITSEPDQGVKAPTRLQRNTTTRMSLRLPGINIKPTPEKHQKKPLMTCSDFFCVASSRLPAVYFERAQANVGRFRANEHSSCAAVILYLPNLTTAIQVNPCIAEEEGRYGKASSLVTRMVAPSRTLIMTSHSVATRRDIVSLTTEKDSPKFVLPAREYPYYIRAPRLEPVATERAHNAACVESTWFFPLNPKSSTKTVRLEKSGVPMRNVILELPALQWAAERSEFDIESQWREARPLQVCILPMRLLQCCWFFRCCKNAKY
jgi:hypothetical protein